MIHKACITDIMENYTSNMFNDYHHSTITLKYLNTTIFDGTQGHIIELGCHEGLTLVLMRYLLNNYCELYGYGIEKDIYGYDNFEGLPKLTEEDTSLIPDQKQFTKGEMVASKDILIENFKSRDLELPIIHSGLFSEITEYPDTISFAHFDGDLYQSILDSFNIVYDRMSVGGIIVIDDYDWGATPGVQQATTEFLSDKKESGKVVNEFGKGIFIKE
jgi:O-methyltransferase